MYAQLPAAYDGGAAVTPSDGTNDPAGPFAGFMATAAGTVKITPVYGGPITVNVVLGIVVPIAFRRVWSTGTSATGVVGLYTAQFKPGPVEP